MPNHWELTGTVEDCCTVRDIQTVLVQIRETGTSDYHERWIPLADISDHDLAYLNRIRLQRGQTLVIRH